MNRLTLAAAVLLYGAQSIAQIPFPAKDSIDINNVHATVLVHGDMWWDPVAQVNHCTYPAGSGHNIMSAGALWLSGYDAGSTLHVAAQTYRQEGNDYWPGPLPASGSLTYATSQSWARIWKINRTDIQAFQALYAAGTATPSNTAAVIWEWPAKGNTHAKGAGGVSLTITDDMAPFKDINGDGLYEPDQGEYPDVKGDQALWYVFNDNGPTHNETGGVPLNVEVHAMIYAYRRWNALDNVVYNQYTVINKSTNTYTNFRAAQMADVDLGYFGDDFIGCDTTRLLGIVYNGKPFDSVYGTSIPMAGIVLRATGVTPTPSSSSFMYYNNNTSVTDGNPTEPAQYDNYMRSRFRNGVHLNDDYTTAGTPTTGLGAGTPIPFAFPGHPNISTEWSECSSGNTPGDRRFVLASNDFTFDPGNSLEVTSILIVTPPSTSNACGDPGFSFNSIDSLSDIAVTVYDEHDLPPELTPVTPFAGGTIRAYPNPANDKVSIEYTGNSTSQPQIVLYNTIGQQMNIPVAISGKTAQLDIRDLPAGLYNILYRQEGGQQALRFIKE